MYQKWLTCLYLISITNLASAFYPYQDQTDSDAEDQNALSTRQDTYEILSERDVQPGGRHPAESSPPLLKLDVHKVEVSRMDFPRLWNKEVILTRISASRQPVC